MIDEKRVFLGFLYYLSLMNYADENEISQINMADYNVHYDLNVVVFVNFKEDSEVIVQVTVKSIKALKAGGSGTGGRYFVYKDGYVAPARFYSYRNKY